MRVPVRRNVPKLEFQAPRMRARGVRCGTPTQGPRVGVVVEFVVRCERIRGPGRNRQWCVGVWHVRSRSPAEDRRRRTVLDPVECCRRYISCAMVEIY